MPYAGGEPRETHGEVVVGRKPAPVAVRNRGNVVALVRAAKHTENRRVGGNGATVRLPRPPEVHKSTAAVEY